MNLFVYGTLKNPTVFHTITKRFPSYQFAVLPLYIQISNLKIKKGTEKDTVLGYLISDISEDELKLLDNYESLDVLYRREKIFVELNTGEAVESWCYIPL